eukprot:UN28508
MLQFPCDTVASGQDCSFTCTENYYPSGSTTCADGVWDVQTCSHCEIHVSGSKCGSMDTLLQSGVSNPIQCADNIMNNCTEKDYFVWGPENGECWCADGVCGANDQTVDSRYAILQTDNCSNEDACTSDPCGDNSTCVDFPLDNTGVYECMCDEHYETDSGDDTLCTEIDECSDSPCMNRSTCEDKLGWFECTCLADYLGARCEIAPNGVYWKFSYEQEVHVTDACLTDTSAFQIMTSEALDLHRDYVTIVETESTCEDSVASRRMTTGHENFHTLTTEIIAPNGRARNLLDVLLADLDAFEDTLNDLVDDNDDITHVVITSDEVTRDEVSNSQNQDDEKDDSDDDSSMMIIIIILVILVVVCILCC